MSKRRPKKSNRVRDAIAYRTRLRMGSVMHRTKPVQHPHCWPLLRELENNKKRRCKSVSPCKAASGSRRRLRRKKEKKSQLRSVIQLITFTRNKRRNRCQIRNHGHSNRRITSKYNRIKRSGSRRGRKMTPKNVSYRQSLYRRNRSRRRAKRYSRRRRRRARDRTSRRTTTKRKRAAAHQKEPRSGQGDEPAKRTPRRKLTSDFSFRRENANMFGPQPAIITENLDKGLDEIKDDPLGMSQVYRAMVNNLPGVPENKKHTQTVKTHDRHILKRDHNMMAITISKQRRKRINNKHGISKIRKRIRRKKLSHKLNRNRPLTRTSVKLMSRRTTKAARKQTRPLICKVNPRKRTTVSAHATRNTLAARKNAHKCKVIRNNIRKPNKRKTTNGHGHHLNRRTADRARHLRHPSGAKRCADTGTRRHRKITALTSNGH